MSNVFEAVCGSVKEVLSLGDDHAISSESKLKDDLGLDSMSTLSFLMSLEDNLQGFVVDPDTLDADHLETINSVVNYVSSEMTAAAAA